MFSNLILLLAVTSFFVGCHLSAASPSAELANATARVKINQPVGDKVPIPLGHTLTIVNVFDEFSTGCPTGNRFETMERLNSLRPTGGATRWKRRRPDSLVIPLRLPVPFQLSLVCWSLS